MGRDKSMRKYSVVVSRLTDRNHQDETVWTHLSKLDSSAERLLDCVWLIVSVRGWLWG